MQIGLVILDGGGRIVLFNTAAEQILGYRAREVRGKPGEEIFDGFADPPAFPSSERPGGEPEMQLKNSAHHKDGRVVPLIVTSYPMPGIDDRTAHVTSGSAERPVHPDNGVILVLQDARQLEKMENQLQHLDRLRSLDEFAAGIVHEIRNPLAGISINAQHMVEEIKKRCQKSCTKSGRPGRFHEEMQDILADVQSIEDIVKRVLDFAHPNRPQVRETPIEDIVKEVLRFSKMPLQRQGIRLVARFGDRSSDSLNTPAKVKVDVPQMKQVLFNIVRNACDAMPRGGRLCVTTARLSTGLRRAEAASAAQAGGEAVGSRHGSTELAEVNGHVRVEVEDTGRGIAEGDLERIFDPFFSMHPDKGSGGTGLGLAISRKIVENHGGRIEVESTPGKGTKFAVVLPTV